MILFQPLRTRRICVRLRELSIGEAIAICKLPAERHEMVATEFLRMVASAAETPQATYITNPRLWTVQERALLVCHYMAQVSTEGPDFAVGQNGLMSDYVVFDSDIKSETVEVGTVAGEKRVVRPLLGIHAEILERLCESRGEWLIGAMACQFSVAGDLEPDLESLGDVKLVEHIESRMEWVRGLPESDFEELLAAYTTAQQGMHHFFDVNFDDAGVIFEPQTNREAGPDHPARFRAVSCISRAARELFGWPDRSGG